MAVMGFVKELENNIPKYHLLVIRFVNLSTSLNIDASPARLKLQLCYYFDQET